MTVDTLNITAGRSTVAFRGYHPTIRQLLKVHLKGLKHLNLIVFFILSPSVSTQACVLQPAISLRLQLEDGKSHRNKELILHSGCRAKNQMKTKSLYLPAACFAAPQHAAASDHNTAERWGLLMRREAACSYEQMCRWHAGDPHGEFIFCSPLIRGVRGATCLQLHHELDCTFTRWFQEYIFMAFGVSALKKKKKWIPSTTISSEKNLHWGWSF